MGECSRGSNRRSTVALIRVLSYLSLLMPRGTDSKHFGETNHFRYGYSYRNAVAFLYIMQVCLFSRSLSLQICIYMSRGVISERRNLTPTSLTCSCSPASTSPELLSEHNLWGQQGPDNLAETHSDLVLNEKCTIYTQHLYIYILYNNLCVRFWIWKMTRLA